MKKKLLLSLSLAITFGIAAMEGKYEEEKVTVTYRINLENKTNDTIALTPSDPKDTRILTLIQPGETKEYVLKHLRELTSRKMATFTLINQSNKKKVGLLLRAAKRTALPKFEASLSIERSDGLFDFLKDEILFDPDKPLLFEVHVKLAGDDLSESSIQIDTSKETDIPEEEEE